jgi:hypothetical protein
VVYGIASLCDVFRKTLPQQVRLAGVVFYQQHFDWSSLHGEASFGSQSDDAGAGSTMG